MNKEERAELAAQYKLSGKYNCCQAVAKAYSDKLSVSEEEMLRLTAGFAVGMGCMEATCGALIGAVMVAGLLTEGRGTVKLSREMLKSFEEKCGATVCGDLKGAETGKVLCPCEDCVRNAVLSAEEVLGVCAS